MEDKGVHSGCVGDVSSKGTVNDSDKHRVWQSGDFVIIIGGVRPAVRSLRQGIWAGEGGSGHVGKFEVNQGLSSL